LLDTQRSVEKLNLDVVTEWHSWYYIGEDNANQIGGYATKYKNLTLATVRGAGHMVPQWRPKQAYEMFKRFLEGKDL
jgi:serine carboxypeptidase-like clade II